MFNSLPQPPTELKKRNKTEKKGHKLELERRKKKGDKKELKKKK